MPWGKQPAVVMTLRRKPLAGYTKSEMEDYSADEPSLTAYFSDDDTLFPVKLELPLPIGSLHVTLRKKCGPQESCLLGLQ
jgi:hypothetical protein